VLKIVQDAHRSNHHATARVHIKTNAYTLNHQEPPTNVLQEPGQPRRNSRFSRRGPNPHTA